MVVNTPLEVIIAIAAVVGAISAPIISKYVMSRKEKKDYEMQLIATLNTQMEKMHTRFTAVEKELESVEKELEEYKSKYKQLLSDHNVLNQKYNQLKQEFNTLKQTQQ